LRWTIVAKAPRSSGGEITPCAHLVPIYQDDGAFLDALEGFVAAGRTAGLTAGHGVVVIDTPAHLESMQRRLQALAGWDPRRAAKGGRRVWAFGEMVALPWGDLRLRPLPSTRSGRDLPERWPAS
jgi:hypothetical protein